MPSLREESADPGRTRRGAVATTARDRSSAVLRDGNEPPEKKQKEISEISIECTNRGIFLGPGHEFNIKILEGGGDIYDHFSTVLTLQMIIIIRACFMTLNLPE